MSVSTASFLVAALAVVLSAVTALLTTQVARRQRSVIQMRETSAGIDRLEMGKFATLRRELLPGLQSRLRILATSGGHSLPSADEMRGLLARGVSIEVLLLDPTHDNFMFTADPNLIDECRRSLEELRWIGRDIRTGRLTVRLYQAPQMVRVVFIDDTLLLSSHRPVAEPGFTYVIRRGERSMFRIYDAAFEFLWLNGSRPDVTVQTGQGAVAPSA